MTCTCPSGDGSLRWPCPSHPPGITPGAEAHIANHGRMEPMTDSLQELIDAQSQLQLKMPTTHPIDLFEELELAESRLPGDARRQADYDRAADDVTEFIQWNHKALIHEAVELESETGWKPWAAKSFVNIEAARGEAIDMLHFLLNDFLVLGMDADEVRRRYHAKHAKNVARQEAGYDGVSTKCPGCHRALDDDAVHCFRGNQRLGGDEAIAGVHCVVRGRFFPNEPAHPRGGTHLEGSFS
ncbi:deoxyuridine triphosphatase [Microbacterium phage BabyDaisy]|nr:deoxyuridine triphosphatase [Microbacterium phage BabyDaisy]